jgi:hypothetical protein
MGSKFFSAKNAVNALKDNDHLPLKFPVTHGLRTFFPSSPGRFFNLLSVSGYLYYRTATLTSDSLQAVCELGADGAGRWALKVTFPGGGNDYSAANMDYGVGFMFHYSQDRVGHGYVNLGSHEKYTEETFTVVISGFDDWIAANWIEAFAQESEFYLTADALEADAGGTTLAKTRGFSNKALLGGAVVKSASTWPAGSGKANDPGVGINFGFGFELPPVIDAPI